MLSDLTDDERVDFEMYLQERIQALRLLKDRPARVDSALAKMGEAETITVEGITFRKTDISNARLLDSAAIEKWVK